MAKKKFPQGVMLGELPKDRPLKNGEQVAWMGKTYTVSIFHVPKDKMRERGFSFSDRRLPGFGVYELVYDGVTNERYIGGANTLFELQDLLGIPAVKES